ncbi:MAG: orotidine-5'-phosphate decarboxylase [candidate division Zixibacteria bacterium]|nr:orotidine-5'-phosphate decarboxylase [candidate division Zixibacteria bacterium]
MTALLEKLAGRTKKTKGILCIGLDPDVEKMPHSIASGPKPLFNFCRRIVEATRDYAAAYKPNLAFFESHGSSGLAQLERLLADMPEEIPIIIDGKRGDIGNTARMYAKYVFNHLGGDAATVNPFLGRDSLEPYFDDPEKTPLVLCLTSNPGSADIQTVTGGEHRIYERIIMLLRRFNKPCGLVVGARHAELLANVRRLAPEWPILIPGVGTQGGDLESSVRIGTQDGEVPAVINVSRDILYQSNKGDFTEAAARRAEWYVGQMAAALDHKKK